MPPKNENPPPETPVPEPEAKAKTGRKIPPIAIYAVAGMILLVAGYFVGTKFIWSSKETGDKKTTESKGAKADEKEKKKGKTEEASTVFMMQDIIVNPSGTSGTRFLSVSIGFEVGSQETFKMFEERQPLIKDALITILGSKTMEQLSDAKQKEITRFQIKKRVEQLLNVEDLAAVYFTDFVLQ